jgi:ribosome-associated translation inhibitor RaiA
MNYNENFQGIKIDVKADEITIPDDLKQALRDIIVKLNRFANEINWADAYFVIEASHPRDKKKFSLRMGVPGPDVFASDSGDHWIPVMKSVEEKLRVQLQKK